MKTIILLLTFTSQILAQLPTKLETLKSKRDAAIENINQIYKQELQKLMTDPLVKANPVELAKIQSELGAKDTTIDMESMSKVKFLNKRFKTELGTIFIFKKDGLGSKSASNVEMPITWRTLESNVVEVVGRDTPESPPKTWYFKFFDGIKKVKYGLSIDSIEWTVTIDD